MFFPFTNYKVQEHLFNDTHNVELLTTTAKSIIFVELISNINFSGAGGGFTINAVSVATAPTTINPSLRLFFYGVVPQNDPSIVTVSGVVIDSGKQIRVFGERYTARIKLHIFELPE